RARLRASAQEAAARMPRAHRRNSMSIEAERCLFIRLGKSGESTEQCISAGQLRLDYPQVAHEFCLAGRWTQVESQIAPQSRDREGAARHSNQIRAFY